MTDLAEFVAARLDEDEAAAKGAQEEWDADWVRYEREDLPDEVYNHVVRHDPARMLREIEAGRKLLQLASHGCPDDCLDHSNEIHAEDEALGSVIMDILAAVWSDHPDYRAEWKS